MNRPHADILVVDDTPANLQLLVSLLSEAGYGVRPVTSGEAALRAAAVVPDLVLLDVNMPGMNGYEVCQRFKRDERTREVPIIFISALADVEEKVAAFRAGGVDYVTKPFQVDEVVARVGTHLALRRATEQARQSYIRLKQLEEQRDSMVHMVVHDMRSPLLSLNLGLEILTDSIPAADKTAVAMMRDCRLCVRTLVDMAGQMLTVSKSEHGALPLQLERIDLCQLAYDAVTACRSQLHGRRIAVEGAKVVEAEVDPQLIRRAMDNLVSNAIKHTPADGRIEVQINVHDGQATFAVRDNGRGIAPELKDKLFTKFGQLRGEDSRRGFGLGLAFVRSSAEAHKGEVGVESVLGSGSTFWFRVPCRASLPKVDVSTP